MAKRTVMIKFETDRPMTDDEIKENIRQALRHRVRTGYDLGFVPDKANVYIMPQKDEDKND